MGFHYEIAVRYGEVDQQGVVFNAHYLAYVDDAMDHWMRLLDADFESMGWDFMVRHAELEWVDGARVGDILAVDAEIVRWGNTSFVVHVLIHVGGRPVFTADMTYVGVEAGTTTPLAAPPQVRRHLGEPAGHGPGQA
jgi:acyl-CoA thioester hydrolase